MPLVTIILNNKNFQLYCNNGEEEELIALAGQLDRKIGEIKLANPSASFELLLIMLALSNQAEMQVMLEHTKKEDTKDTSDKEEEFAKTLSTIASYLENLAHKIGK